MTETPDESATCTAEITNEHSGGFHRCTLEVGHSGGQFDGAHAGPVDEKGVRYCWSDQAIGAVPHKPAAPTPPADENLRDRIAAAIAESDGVPSFEFAAKLHRAACLREADAVLAVLPAAWGSFELRGTAEIRAAALSEAAALADEEARHLYDDMGQKAAAGARFVGARLRRLADEAQQAEPDTDAHPAEHTWSAELHDPLAEEWVPGTRYSDRARAVNHLTHSRAIGPTWTDGTPTRRRLVRATTTYTVEAEHTPEQM